MKMALFITTYGHLSKYACGKFGAFAHRFKSWFIKELTSLRVKRPALWSGRTLAAWPSENIVAQVVRKNL